MPINVIIPTSIFQFHGRRRSQWNGCVTPARGTLDDLGNRPPFSQTYGTTSPDPPEAEEQEQVDYVLVDEGVAGVRNLGGPEQPYEQSSAIGRYPAPDPEY